MKKSSRLSKPAAVRAKPKDSARLPIFPELESVEKSAGVLFDAATHAKNVSNEQHKCLGQIYVALQMVRTSWKNKRLVAAYAEILDGITDKLVDAHARERRNKGR